jgi:aryl-alcohol dehydrogenase-like predicted oxidoreductase
MSQPVPLRKLGKSDLVVSAIGLGCWQFAQGKGLVGNYWAMIPDEEIREVVRISLEAGINWFDTAESYGGGQSERVLAAALKSLGVKAGDVLVATKWRPFFRTARSILGTIDERLAALGGFSIALHQIHQPYSLSSVQAQMNAMADLVDAGKIRYIGVSNFSARRMRLAHEALGRRGLSLVSNQVRYSLLDRSIERNGILETARELGVSIIGYSPLAQGILTGKFHEQPGLVRSKPGYRKYLRAFRPAGLQASLPLIQGLREQAKKYGRTPGQIALNWLINAHGDLVVAIPGAMSAAQARENSGALDFTLSKDDIDFLSGVSSGSRS